jgi:hypothetical protein
MEDRSVSGRLRAAPDAQRTFVLLHYIFHQRHPIPLPLDLVMKNR